MANEQPGPWASELDDYLRAFSGAYIFGIPLLYTMEMWWIGTFVPLWKLVAFLAVAFGAALMLIHFASFKEQTTEGPFFLMVDAVAVGIVAAILVLLVLNRIHGDIPLESAIGMIIVQAVPLSIGAAAAGALVSRRGKSREGQDGQPDRSPGREALNDIGATTAGGVFIGFSIAPTDEVPMLAAEMNYINEIVLVLFALLVTYVIVFESGFSPQRESRERRSPLQHPLVETVTAYAVFVLIAIVSLYFFGQVEIGDPISKAVSQVVALSLPVAVGGAAGRLVI